MIEHMDIWLAIDRLATAHGLSASGLARKAGLDPTSFNPSKRAATGGKLRWPTTESIAKILAATGTNFSDFVALVEREDFEPTSPAELSKLNYSAPRSVPVLGFAEAAQASNFDSNGFPAGKEWEQIKIPTLQDPHAYALAVSGSTMEPAYRAGDILILSPREPIRKGDRVVLKTVDGKVAAKEVVKKTATKLDVKSLNPAHKE
ncbi:MAG TPA: helix-turn-helix transcriptional regulator, partial [Alphaproteobacteria bacterium]|nr:helix-turn-helix transcriptional regulator [Alphaproteobacteria bacterium]